ncbi:MAG: ammonium transporter [Brevinematia bacterium]
MKTSKRFFKLIVAFSVFMCFSMFAMADDVSNIDTGDTSWMIVATALVMLMTVPGLALFYGGMTKKKSVLNTILMSFVAFALTTVIWVLYGYSLAFSGDIGGVIGDLSKFLIPVKGNVVGSIPEYIFIVFQLTFAAITVALISGGVIERMKFYSWFIFTILWVSIVYVPIAHWVWGNGFLMNLGALDFAGGTVVHINAGISALALVLLLGKRNEPILIPHNVILTMIGAALLWFGWFGFNAGSALGANELASIAFLNTILATSISAVTWMMIESIFLNKSTAVGFASGIVSGLVAITPAAGFVNVSGSIIIGIVAGILPFFVITYIKPLLGYDDSLDVFGIHGIAGIAGSILTGIFADPKINSAGVGLIYGNYNQVFIQIIAVAVVIIYSFIATLVISIVVKYINGLRVDKNSEVVGIDQIEHGEKAYNLHI